MFRSFARASTRLSEWLRRLAVVLLALAITTLVWFTNVLAGTEDSIRNALFTAQSRAASGQIHIVEMDAASLSEIARWPWPRSHYADAVTQLSRAGARSITFDVDFSTPADPAGDAAFAKALAQSDAAIVLPTFAQRAGQGESRVLDALPIPALRRHAILASVAVLPDGDGFVRRMPLGTITAATPRPSLSAQIAGHPGTVGTSFPIDLSIDPASIPRHSFAAVKDGRFRPSDVAGKDILIGATAIEMGDRYAVARYGVLPGVVVQALAAETLLTGQTYSSGPLALLLLATILASLIVSAPTLRQVRDRAIAAALLVVGVYAMAWGAASILFEIVPALAILAFTCILSAVRLYRRELLLKRLHDPVTGLPNRAAMERRDDPEAKAAVVALVDDFEALQSVLGEARMATLMLRLSERLAAGLDAKQVYRLDDRLLAWSSPATGSDLESVLSQLATIMRRPFEVDGRQIDVGVFYGIADANALAEAAHAAAQAQKQGSRWQIHIADARSALEQQMSLMGELDTAIGAQQLEVVYQPKLHLSTETITSVEALVRWNHPEHGYLPPDSFIPLAESSDRICDLTLFVIGRAIEQLQAWCEAGVVMSAAVNISARLVASEHFLARAEMLLEQSGVPRQRLIFEVTESATITDPVAAQAALQRFRDLGIAISMDDYGTGQSTLTYLKQLPLSELKIDRSFVMNAHRDRSDALLVRSTIDLAHELGLTVVAEGVEETECLDFLRSAGCDYAQGYLIGRPMSAADLESRLLAPPSLAA